MSRSFLQHSMKSFDSQEQIHFNSVQVLHEPWQSYVDADKENLNNVLVCQVTFVSQEQGRMSSV
jgi:hypothetical protein